MLGSFADLPHIRDRLAQATLELLQIPSVTGHEAAIASYLERWALSLPHLDRDDIVRYGNALMVGSPDLRRPCVALVGHTDTVPGRPSDPAPHQDGDRIVGLGASDMKAAIAVMQVLFEQLDLKTLPFALMLVLYDREEGPYQDNGLQPLLDHFDVMQGIDLAVAMEPTDNTLQPGCMGGIQASIIFHGRAAHSGRPWQGDNAIHKAGPFLNELRERPFRDIEVQELIFREAASITMAHGGQSRNVIPDRFELNLNYRFAPQLPVEQTIQRITDEIHRLAGHAEVKILDIAPPGPIPTNNPVLEHLRTLGQLKTEAKQAWTDVARLAQHGIDAVNFGPGMGAQAHQANEWVSWADICQAYDILTRVLTTPLATPA